MSHTPGLWGLAPRTRMYWTGWAESGSLSERAPPALVILRFCPLAEAEGAGVIEFLFGDVGHHVGHGGDEEDRHAKDQERDLEGVPAAEDQGEDQRQTGEPDEAALADGGHDGAERRQHGEIGEAQGDDEGDGQGLHVGSEADPQLRAEALVHPERTDGRYYLIGPRQHDERGLPPDQQKDERLGGDQN